MVRKTKASEVKEPKKTTKKTKKADLVGEVKEKVEKWVETIKETVEETVDMFSDELETVKKTWFDLIKRIKENRDVLLWIVFLAIWLWQLRQFVVWILFIIAGVLFISGIVNDKLKN